MLYNPLNIREGVNGSYIEFPMEIELSGDLFYCKSQKNYTSKENGNFREVARYEIVDRADNERTFIIEAIKITENDYDLRYYEKLEDVDFDAEFMGMVGTSPFGYFHPKHDEELIYDKIAQEGEEFVDQDFELDVSLEEDDSYMDWAQEDENGWYYTVSRSTGILREFSDKSKTYSWIYDRQPKPHKPIYMLIEIKALNDYAEYELKRPKISIYEGKKLLVSDIKTT